MDTIPIPGELRADPTARDYVEEQLLRERYNEQYSEGKINFLSTLIPGRTKPKPYMYVQRDSCHTIRQKLEVKSDLQPLEYMDAVLKLVEDDDSAWSEDERKLIRKHLGNVTHDAMSRPWADVRRWSDFIFDQVEKGQLKWTEKQEIQNFRVEISMTGGGREKTSGANPNYGGNH